MESWVWLVENVYRPWFFSWKINFPKPVWLLENTTCFSGPFSQYKLIDRLDIFYLRLFVHFKWVRYGRIYRIFMISRKYQYTDAVLNGLIFVWPFGYDSHIFFSVVVSSLWLNTIIDGCGIWQCYERRYRYFVSALPRAYFLSLFQQNADLYHAKTKKLEIAI